MQYNVRKLEIGRGMPGEDRHKGVRINSVAEAADRFALQATESILAPDRNVESLDSLAKAMRPLTGP